MSSESIAAKKKRKWILLIIGALLVIGAATGLTVYFVKFYNKSPSSSSVTGSLSGANNANADKTGDIVIDPRLKKVFYGMAFTPLNSQYPSCGASQANVTANIATLSQLTSRIRLYGNDCNQTEFVLNAIQKLKVDMTVTLGIWLDSDTATNNRQLSQFYSIINNYPMTMFDGVYVGNEVLYSKTLTSTQLISIIQGVKANLTSMGKIMPVGTSDLGSNWAVEPELAQAVDIIGTNTHPFFSGMLLPKVVMYLLIFCQ